MSYLIATEELSLSEQARLRQGAANQGIARASKLWQVAPNSLTVRDADYVNDFLVPAGVAVVAIAGWLSMPLAIVGNWYSVFASSVPAAVAPVVPTNQIWVFYKVAQLTLAGPDPVAGLQFRIGAAANLRAYFDMENINGKMVSDGYFSQPVTYENPDVCAVTVEARVAIAVGARVKLGCFIVEPLQNTVI